MIIPKYHEPRGSNVEIEIGDGAIERLERVMDAALSGGFAHSEKDEERKRYGQR